MKSMQKCKADNARPKFHDYFLSPMKGRLKAGHIEAGQGRAGQGRAGQGRAGQGRAKSSLLTVKFKLKLN